MPRAAKFPVQIIFDSVKDLMFFDDSGELKSLSQSVWNDAVLKMRNEISIKHMYLYISRNDHKIQDMLREWHGVGQNLEISTSKKNRSCDSNHSNWSMNASRELLSPLRATITISGDDWNSIRVRDISYKDRNYKVLRRGWTDILQEQLWREHKLPCCYTFKNPKINENPVELYVMIKGSCTECNVEINLYALDKPTENGLTLQVSTSNTKEIEHKKKRQLRGENRKRVAKEVTAQSTYAWRRQKANELMEFGDKVPAHLYNEDVLRKAKQTESDRELRLRKGVDVLESMRELKYRPEFVGTIREIGYDKFFAMYWSPEQIFLYKKYCKDVSKIGSLSIDATGSIVRSITKPDGSSSTIYLYQGVIPFNTKILPVVQMISEKHDANILSYWLREWLRSGVPCPTEIVIDYALALLNAVCLAFETIDLNTYVDRCFALAEGNCSITKPRCYIRIDIAHLIKLVTRWKCFRNTHIRVKEFFLRCIGLLAKCTTFKSFESLLRDTLIVAFSETEDVNSNDNCFSAQKRLIQNIKSVNEKEIDAVIEKEINYENDNSEDNFAVDLETFEFDVTGKLSIFLQELENDCKQRAQIGDRPNPYWCPNFANSLLRISKHFTLWTCVLAPNGTIATSSRSEEYFRELKNLILKGDRNLRVDKFIIKHIRSIFGTEKLLNAACDSTDKSQIIITSSEISKLDMSTSEISKSENAVSKLDMISKIDTKLEIEEISNCGEIEKLSVSHEEPIELDAVSKFRETETSEFSTSYETSIEKAEMNVKHFEGIYSFIYEEENWGGKNLSRTESCNIENQAKRTKYEILCPMVDSVVDEPDANLLKEKLNVKTSKRGKYLTPCPDIENILQKPSRNANLPLLKNGQLLGRVRVAGKDVTFYNTCPFDTLAQSVLAGYRDWASYHNYITVSKNEFYDFIKTFSTYGAVAQTYKKRSTLLSNIFKVKNNEINCYSNISNFVSSNLLTNEPSYQITQQCCDCGDIIDNRPVIDINTKPFYEKGMQALESSINDKICDEFYKNCIRCGSNNVLSKVSSGNHLFIDIECLQWLKLAANMGYKNWPGVFTISQIPSKLIVGKLNYRLVSAIEYIGNSDPKYVGHYVAYIRRITGRWEVHNDLGANKKPILITARALLQKRKLAMLMYVKET